MSLFLCILFFCFFSSSTSSVFYPLFLSFIVSHCLYHSSPFVLTFPLFFCAVFIYLSFLHIFYLSLIFFLFSFFFLQLPHSSHRYHGLHLHHLNPFSSFYLLFSFFPSSSLLSPRAPVPQLSITDAKRLTTYIGATWTPSNLPLCLPQVRVCMDEPQKVTPTDRLMTAPPQVKCCPLVLLFLVGSPLFAILCAFVYAV